MPPKGSFQSRLWLPTLVMCRRELLSDLACGQHSITQLSRPQKLDEGKEARPRFAGRRLPAQPPIDGRVGERSLSPLCGAAAPCAAEGFFPLPLVVTNPSYVPPRASFRSRLWSALYVWGQYVQQAGLLRDDGGDVVPRVGVRVPLREGPLGGVGGERFGCVGLGTVL